MVPRSAGKDSTTGHWEIAGVHLPKPFPTYPNGFPTDLVPISRGEPGGRSIGNVAGSGTAVIDEFGPEHQRTRRVDPVHVGRLGLPGRRARGRGPPRGAVSRRARSLARCSWRRTTCRASSLGRSSGTPAPIRVPRTGVISRSRRRRDAARRARRGRDPARGVGKVDDLFAGRAIQSTHSASNADGIRSIAEWLARRKWVAFREPSRFRPGIWAPERCSGVLWCVAAVRCRPTAPAVPAYERTICCSLPPTTGTTRRPPRPTTRASVCRCWRSAAP